LLRLSYLKERMTMHLLYFASITEVEVWTDAALISDTLNRTNSTAIAGYSIMDLRGLFSSSFTKVVNHQSLEGLSSIRLDFLLNYLDKISVKFIL
jgi:hypothetical protein